MPIIKFIPYSIYTKDVHHGTLNINNITSIGIRVSGWTNEVKQSGKSTLALFKIRAKTYKHTMHSIKNYNVKI